MICIDISSLNGNRYWFWDVAFFSDWQNKQSDYATNAVVHNFYNEEAKWYRTNKYKKFLKLDGYYMPEEVVYKLQNKDTVKIGMDKYALMNISSSLFPPDILRANMNELHKSVIVYELFVKDSLLIWRKERWSGHSIK